MLTNPQARLVAVEDDQAREPVAENLLVDGYEPITATSLGHAKSRITHHVDVMIVALGDDTQKPISVVREWDVTGVDPERRSSLLRRVRMCFIRSGCSNAALTT